MSLNNEKYIETIVSIEDMIILNNSPTVNDIKEAKENELTIVCNRPTDEVLKDYVLISDNLKDHIIFYDCPLITDDEFEIRIKKIIKKNKRLSWIKRGIDL